MTIPIGVFSVVGTTTINLKEFSTILATASLIVECAGIASAGTTATLGNLIGQDFASVDQSNESANTIRIEVIGARTTAPKQALIPSAAIRSFTCRCSASPQTSMKARPIAAPKKSRRKDPASTAPRIDGSRRS